VEHICLDAALGDGGALRKPAAGRARRLLERLGVEAPQRLEELQPPGVESAGVVRKRLDERVHKLAAVLRCSAVAALQCCVVRRDL
jgi:hypothetical protein